MEKYSSRQTYAVGFYRPKPEYLLQLFNLFLQAHFLPPKRSFDMGAESAPFKAVVKMLQHRGISRHSLFDVRIAQDSIRKGYDATSLGKRFPKFLDNIVVSYGSAETCIMCDLGQADP